jgi:hypothetical protein
MQALVRARIPYLPIHIDNIERRNREVEVLILPNIGAMSDAQCASIRRFVERGGGLVATGATSLYDEYGDPRRDFGLAGVFGAHAASLPERRWASQSFHTYLRLAPELRARVWGPKAGDEPAPAGERHAVLRGFEETDILPFGGMLTPLKTDPGVAVPLTFVPPFPVYPPETAWMREPKTEIPGLVLNRRVAFLPADIDRRFSRDSLPDHGDLLANIIRYIAGYSIPLTVDGRGLIDCSLYTQPGRVIFHLVNLTSAASWRAPIDGLIPVGPFSIKLRPPEGVAGHRVRFLVAGGDLTPARERDMLAFEVKSVLDHEVMVVE